METNHFGRYADPNLRLEMRHVALVVPSSVFSIQNFGMRTNTLPKESVTSVMSLYISAVSKLLTTTPASNPAAATMPTAASVRVRTGEDACVQETP